MNTFINTFKLNTVFYLFVYIGFMCIQYYHIEKAVVLIKAAY